MPYSQNHHRMATVSLMILISFLFTFAECGSIGINYGRIANNLPTPSDVVSLLKSHGIDRVKLYDTDSSVLTALANSGINVVVALPNELLSSAAASDQSFADTWLRSNVAKYLPATNIVAIAIGNEVFVDPNNTTRFLIPAMKNIHKSLKKLGLDSKVKLSSPIALSCLQSSYPSSSGSFKPELADPVMKPMLQFLSQTGSHLMVNVYPFFAYAANSDQISLDYALFRSNPGSVDSGNGLKYLSLFEAQVDAVYAATSALGYDDVKVVVSETGWPSAGDENEVGAGAQNAASYNGNLVRRVLTTGGTGTPRRPRDPLDVYLFALFNENQKTGPTSERNYGLFYPNKDKVYDIPLTAAEVNGEVQSAQPSNGSKTQVPVGSGSNGGDVSSAGVGKDTWCVASEGAGKEKLQAALDYACGEGGADCRPIQKGATCYNPGSAVAHASYAFNSYYQKKGRGAGTCYFGGAAYVVTQPPTYGQCKFPTGY